MEWGKVTNLIKTIGTKLLDLLKSNDTSAITNSSRNITINTGDNSPVNIILPPEINIDQLTQIAKEDPALFQYYYTNHTQQRVENKFDEIKSLPDNEQIKFIADSSAVVLSEIVSKSSHQAQASSWSVVDTNDDKNEDEDGNNK